MTFTGKTAFVAGGATGIGRATARAFAREGANVVILDRNAEKLAETAHLIEQDGGKAFAVDGDVRSPDDIARAIEIAAAEFGGIDIAHNNAGIIDTHRDLTDTDMADFREVMETNLFGVANCLKAELPHMAARGGGVIINTASVSGLTALAGLASYVASKHAVIGLTRAVALEAAPKKIRVNCICPAFVETPLTAGLFDTDPDARAAIIAQHPAGWICQPDNIADAVLWLASDKSAYVVGAALTIDGGFTVL